MGIISVLIFISLIIAIGFLIVFIWNLKTGQYDDTYSPSVRILFDDKPKHKPNKEHSTKEILRETEEHRSERDETYGKNVL